MRGKFIDEATTKVLACCETTFGSDNIVSRVVLICFSFEHNHLLWCRFKDERAFVAEISSNDTFQSQRVAHSFSFLFS